MISVLFSYLPEHIPELKVLQPNKFAYKETTVFLIGFDLVRVEYSPLRELIHSVVNWISPFLVAE